MTICKRIGAMVAAWTAAITLAVVNTIDHSYYYTTLPWLVICLSAAITLSISVMIWRAQTDVVADLREGGYDEYEEQVLRVVP